MTDPAVLLDAARRIVLSEASAVSAVAGQLDDSFVQVVAMLLDTKGKVFVTGSGTSGAVARRMGHLLAVCGTPSTFIHPMDALHGTMGVLTRGDVLIAISRGGESHEINDLSTRAIDRGLAVIALTAQPASTLGRLADITVVLETEGDADPAE